MPTKKKKSTVKSQYSPTIVLLCSVPCQLIAYASHTPQPLTSPGWPQPYFQNLDCKWVLNGRRGFRIMIQILALDIGEQTLQVHPQKFSINCNYILIDIK